MKTKTKSAKHLVIDITATELLANYLETTADVLKDSVGERTVFADTLDNIKDLHDAIVTRDEYKLRNFFKAGNTMFLMAAVMDKIEAADLVTINVTIAADHNRGEEIIEIRNEDIEF